MYRVLVAEDDVIIRNSLVNYIRKNDQELEIMGEAENGMQALELCRDIEPDIVITDVMMPQMDGIELIQKLREKYYDVKSIIISGHDEFAYAQSALSLDVADYLLKPFLPEKLAQTLSKVKESLERQRNFYNNMKNLQKRLEESMPIVRERFYIDLVSGHLTLEDIINKSHYLNINIEASYYGVSVIKVNKNKMAERKNISKEELLQFFLMDTVGQMFDKNIRTYVFGISDNQLGIILCGNYEHKHQFFQNINKSLTNLITSMANYYDVVIYASIGKLYEDIIKLPLSYREAKEAMAYSFAIEANTVINYDEIFLNGVKTYERPSQLIKEIVLYTKICNEFEAIKRIENMFEYYRQNHVIEPDFIKTDVIDVVLALQRYIEESKGNFKFLYQQGSGPYEQIQKADTLYGLSDLLENIVKLTICEIARIKKGHSSFIIEKLKSIIADNTGNEEFNLDQAASMLYISPNYLRQLFKEQTGETFTEYLTAQRMKKAAELIADPTIKISDISEMVGYGSQSYFSKCFKKYFRVAPSEYREEGV